MTGLWVRIYTPDGFIDSRNGEKLTYFQDELLNMGERKIKISYGEAFTFFFVNVDAPGEDSVELLEVPDKVEYTKGEKLDLKGLKVRVIKADGTHFESLNGDKLTIFDGPLDNVGERKIKVSYGEAFTFFYVTVNEGTTDSTEPTTPTEPTTEPTTPTEPVDSTEPSEEGTTTPTKPPTEPPTEPSKGDEAVNPTTNEADEKDAQRKTGMPWWGILLIAIAAAGTGVAITILVLKKKK